MNSFRCVVLDLYNVSVCEHATFGKKFHVPIVPQFKLLDQLFMSINSLYCCLRTDGILKK